MHGTRSHLLRLLFLLLFFLNNRAKCNGRCNESAGGHLEVLKSNALVVIKRSVHELLVRRLKLRDPTRVLSVRGAQRGVLDLELREASGEPSIAEEAFHYRAR